MSPVQDAPAGTRHGALWRRNRAAGTSGHPRADVLVACWWLGIHGTRAWRRRWKRWAESVHLDLAHERWGVPDPPDRDESGEEAVKDQAKGGGEQ